MKVDRIELYHIHRRNFHDDSWHVGNSIDTPNAEYNYFYNGIITTYHSKVLINGEQYDLIEYLRYKFERLKESNQVIETMDRLRDFNGHILSVLNNTFYSLLNSRNAFRESQFENVRQSNYSDLPSRQKCFWLCELNAVETWWNDFEDKKNNSIFKVIATGNLFKADGSHIKLDISRLTDFINLAELYWKGQSNSPEIALPELLFEGNLKIIANYDSPSQVKNGS